MLAAIGGLSSFIAACSARTAQPPAAVGFRPTASVQELMQAVIDPSADGVWNAVETITTAAGESVRQPKSSPEWQEVRHAAITLAESANLLLIDGRRAGAQEFPAEASGALDSKHIQQLIAAQRPAFNGFAEALRSAALLAVAAIDARDPIQLVSAGGAIDQVCEGCHLVFWYPNQVIPPLP
jgi:hypothetical protein